MPNGVCSTAALQPPYLKMHIGIAEDDPDQAALIGLWLEGAGHSVRAFGTAAACIVLQIPYRFLPMFQE